MKLIGKNLASQKELRLTCTQGDTGQSRISRTFLLADQNIETLMLANEVSVQIALST